MTRGRIIYIAGTGMMHSTCEFKGDMYPTGNGNQIIEKFQEGGFQSVFDFERYVERFNNRNYEYDEPFGSRELTKDFEWNIDNNLSDYVYVINGSVKGFFLISHGEKYIIPVNGMAIVHFDKVEEILTFETDYRKIRKNVIKEILMSDIDRKNMHQPGIMHPFLKELEKTWELCPDLRFGQLVMDIVPDEDRRFYMSNGAFIKAIQEFREKLK